MRVGGLGGAGQRLRSGAFAPDFPCVIFVTACGSSFRFPWAYRLPAPPRPPPRTAVLEQACRSPGRSGFFRFLPRAGWWWTILRGPPQAGRPGGLVGLTRCLASRDDAARRWSSLAIHEALLTIAVTSSSGRLPARACIRIGQLQFGGYLVQARDIDARLFSALGANTRGAHRRAAAS